MSALSENEEKALAIASAIIGAHAAKWPVDSGLNLDKASRAAVQVYNRVLYHVQHGVKDD